MSTNRGREAPTPTLKRSAAKRAATWIEAAQATSLALAVLLLFAPVRRYGFILFDDPLYVTDNPRVRRGLSLEGVRWAFTAFGYAGNWHPLTWVSHMLDVELFGLRAGAHHMVSVAIHALAAVLFFLGARSLLLQGFGGRWGPRIAAWWMAMAFALHPARLESVVWVSERKDVLAGLAWALALALYTADLRGGTRGRQAWVGLAMLAGLLCKPTLVGLPFVLVLLDFWPGRANEGATTYEVLVRSLKAKVHLFALSAGFAALVMTAQAKGGAVASWSAVPLSTRLANAAVQYLDYARKLVWPSGLAVFYPYPMQGVPIGAAVVAVLALVAITLYAAWKRGTCPWLLVGWLWYVVALLPMAGIVQVGMQAAADRYTYLPHMGLLLILASAGLSLVRARPGLGPWVAGAGAVAILCWAGVSKRDLPYWRDSEALLERAAAVTQKNYLAYHGLGLLYADRGDLGRALEYQERALAAYPGFGPARRERGRLLVALGRTEEGLRELRQAVVLMPEDDQAWVDLCGALGALGRHEEALDACRQATRVRPGSFVALNQLGVALEAMGRRAEALRAYLRAAELRPDAFEPRLNAGGVLLRMGRYAEAERWFRVALALRAGDAEARQGLALALLSQGRIDEAALECTRLEKTDPERGAKVREAIRARASERREDRTRAIR